MSDMSQGILYVSTGEKYAEETLRSAASVRAHMPGVPIALFTDREPASGLFDIVRIIGNPAYSFQDKIAPLCESPFEKTIFIDTDTLFLGPVTEVFDLLDRFDLAYCHGPWRVSPGSVTHLEVAPECFTEPNTGMIAFRRNEEVRRLFVSWAEIYAVRMASPAPPLHDQPAFREALYQSNVRSYVLPPEYNFRTPFPAFKGGGMNVKMLHGRGDKLDEAARVVPNINGVAVFQFGKKPAG